VLRLLGAFALLCKRTVGVEEGRLRDVLRIRGVAQDRERVAVHVPDVPLVHPLEGTVRTRPLRKQGRHALVDTSSSRILRRSFTATWVPEAPEPAIEAAEAPGARRPVARRSPDRPSRRRPAPYPPPGGSGSGRSARPPRAPGSRRPRQVGP